MPRRPHSLTSRLYGSEAPHRTIGGERAALSSRRRATLYEETCSMILASSAALPGNPVSKASTTRSCLTNGTITVGKVLANVRGSSAVEENVQMTGTLSVLLDSFYS